MINSHMRLSILGLLLLSCVAFEEVYPQSESSYLPPTIEDVATRASVSEPFDVVWDRLVERLATSFFAINNIEKESRIINVSFSSDTPEDFIDCGKTTRSYSFGGPANEYNYLGAEDSFYTATEYSRAEQQYLVVDVVRETSLRGRINIYIAPVETGTMATVNALFDFDVAHRTTSHSYNPYGGGTLSSGRRELATSLPSITFTSVESGRGDPLVCRSRGILENQILGWARGRETVD